MVEALQGAGVAGGPIPGLITDCMHERAGAVGLAAPAAAPPANGAEAATTAAAAPPGPAKRASVDSALCVIDGLMFLSPRCGSSSVGPLLVGGGAQLLRPRRSTRPRDVYTWRTVLPTCLAQGQAAAGAVQGLPDGQDAQGRHLGALGRHPARGGEPQQSRAVRGCLARCCSRARRSTGRWEVATQLFIAGAAPRAGRKETSQLQPLPWPPGCAPGPPRRSSTRFLGTQRARSCSTFTWTGGMQRRARGGAAVDDTSWKQVRSQVSPRNPPHPLSLSPRCHPPLLQRCQGHERQDAAHGGGGADHCRGAAGRGPPAGSAGGAPAGPRPRGAVPGARVSPLLPLPLQARAAPFALR